VNIMRATPIETITPRAAAHRRRGFTLIELLVVISVISILAAILYPAVKTALRSSHIQTTKITLAQVGTAIELFKEMHGEYPLCASGEFNNPYVVFQLGTLLKIKETSFVNIGTKSAGTPPVTVKYGTVVDSWARPLVYTRYVKTATNQTPGSDNGEGAVQPIKNPRTYDLFSCGPNAELVGVDPRETTATATNSPLRNDGLGYAYDGKPLTGSRAGEFNNYIGNW
jgi:prepilin-type N-terminal cleavage/methylation domain-containing protein